MWVPKEPNNQIGVPSLFCLCHSLEIRLMDESECRKSCLQCSTADQVMEHAFQILFAFCWLTNEWSTSLNQAMDACYVPLCAPSMLLVKSHQFIQKANYKDTINEWYCQAMLCLFDRVIPKPYMFIRPSNQQWDMHPITVPASYNFICIVHVFVL